MVKNILLIGLGGFGKKHLRAWMELGYGQNLYVVDLDPAALKECTKLGIPEAYVGTDYRKFLPQVDAVDIVTGVESHFPIVREILEAGKPVFVEKPLTIDSAESTQLAMLAAQKKLVLQVGFQYRYNALTQYAKQLIAKGEIGALRYLRGDFLGFKRPRIDVGAAHTDAIHFIDLCNYLIGGHPKSVQATLRAYMPRPNPRGALMDDLALIQLEYDGPLALIEAGFLQPGDANDKIVPGATETKKMLIVGERGAIRIDYVKEELTIFREWHEQKEGKWIAVNQGSESPRIIVRDPVLVELEAFLINIEGGKNPLTNAMESGYVPVVIVEALYRAAREGKAVEIKY